MSANTRIEWSDATWSPTLGCTKVSPGCDRCYAIRTVHRLAANPNPKVHKAAEGLTAYRPGVGPVWTGDVRTLPNRLDLPLRWRKPKRIFVDSQSDLFHGQVPDDFIARVFAVMAATPQHTYQLLTKRHGRMRSLLADPGWTDYVAAVHGEAHDGVDHDLTIRNPLPNVWVGVSVEDQQRADLRIPALLDTPAAVRWISAEPLLGPVDLTTVGPDRFRVLDPSDMGYESNGPAGWIGGPTIDWVVAGGESGPDARPMHPAWARSLRDQCAAAGVPFLFKQWGEWGPLPRLDEAGRDRNDPCVAVANDGTVYQAGDLSWPDGPRAGEAIRAGHDRTRDLHHLYRAGKKAAGRELDGVVHDEYPAAAP